MKRTLIASIALLTALFTVQGQSYTISLDGAQDGGGARQGTGSGTLSLSGNQLTFENITFSGLTENFSALHIHGPAAAGTSIGVLYDLATFTTPGLNTATAGSISGTLTLVDNPSGRTFSIAEQIDDLNASLWYINVHNLTAFPGGEIRGQILPVPEPGTWALVGTGLAGLWWIRRRKTT